MNALAEKMHRALSHRGPDASGIWQDPDAPVTLAHRRLAIIDLSPDGRQPMVSSSGRFIIVFNGEIYNYLDLKRDLQSAGRTFKSRSDTEVILESVEHWGLNQTLQKLSGMFAFALWDRQAREIHFVRDRFGKKPLYIGWAGNDLVFASELKSFHVHPAFQKNIDRDVLASYMRYGYVCAPLAIFRDVWQLLPGGRVSLKLSDIRPRQNMADKMESYWHLPSVIADKKSHPHHVSEADAINEFETLLYKNVKDRMMSDVPLGAFLSGGIDSSAVTALMQKNTSQPVKTFSIGFTENAYNEAQHAKAVAHHLGTDHREFYVTANDALDVIPKLADIYDEPFADYSQIPTYLISKLAREYVTVVLTGDGGDEILGGYQRHTHIPAVWNKISWMPHPVRRMISSAATAVSPAFYDRMKPSYPQFGRRMHRLAGLVALKSPSAVYDNLVGAWPNAQDIVPGSHLPSIPLTDPAWQVPGLTFAEKMMYGDTLSYRPNDLMVKTDRATMAVSLEARAPLMDHTLCEYAWTLPHDLKVRGMTGKWLLRQVLKKHVPTALFERPKMGFGVPVGDWLRGPLKNWGNDLLSPARLKDQGLLDASLVSQAWQDHQNGITRDANANDLWAALMFQTWHDRWIKE